MSGRGRPCSVCGDPRRPALEEELARPNRRSYALLEDSFRGLKADAIRRHHLAHIAPAPPGLIPPPGPKKASDVVGLGETLELMTTALLEDASQSGSFRDAANALRVGLETHGALLKLHAARPPEFDPLRDEVLRRLVEAIGRALDDLPEARERVLAAMREATS